MNKYEGVKFRLTRDAFIHGELYKGQTFTPNYSGRAWILDNPTQSQSKSWLVANVDKEIDKGLESGWLERADGIKASNLTDSLLHGSIIRILKGEHPFMVSQIDKTGIIVKDGQEWYLLQNDNNGSPCSQTLLDLYGTKYSWSLCSQNPNDLIDKGIISIISTQTDMRANNISQTKGALKTTMDSITRKIKKLLRTEPEKSFIEQGITLEDGSLTTDGRDAFIQWQFDKARNEFYTDVVKPIVDAEKK